MRQAMEFRPRGPDRRSGLDRRSGFERRHQQRRIAVVAVAADRRRSVERRGGVRRRGAVRRRTPDRRGAHAALLHDRDRQRARRLPDLCLTLEGTPVDRITEVVATTWTHYPVPVRAGMAEDLLPLIAPVITGERKVTDDLREACERVIESWVGRMRQA